MRYSPRSAIILEATDIFGAIVRFEKRNYDNHKDKHPELRQKQFCPGQITMALEKPNFVIQGNQEGTLCYYLELFRFRDIIKYAKVVVQETNRLRKKDPHCIIKTAFKTDHIKELKYGFKPTYFN
jgi:hypothetical protein